ncbi:transmembrane 4 L6 family member 1-like [Scleropages formosus]|uniref:Transmembrane 4 L six family member 18 n=1 Tax=Scleropages formosus TaxID=113540 RepID=A0A0P7VC22_SCLFO|nr:transmembrane 4 L6 family member 1-like [Scleropages formosus]KPP80008.1 transmembrane 4 L6 family member 1-like [Scleropages formosus]
MWSVSFTRSLGLALIPLAVCCIAANVLLFFPNGYFIYAEEGNLTVYVWYFMGIAGGGIMMLLPAAVFVILPKYGDCCERESCVMCGSVLAALVGLAGAGYCFIISALALMDGPKCFTMLGWRYPFRNGGGRYLTETETWAICLQPISVVEWNVTIFSILLALSTLEAIICSVQAVNGLMVAVCRPCCYKQNYSLNP